MRAGAPAIHGGFSGLTALYASEVEFFEFFYVSELFFQGTADVGAARCILADAEFKSLLERASDSKQIDQLLVVNFNHVALERDCEVASFGLLDKPKELGKRARDDTRLVGVTLQSVGLATACLPIREETHVVAFDSRLDQSTAVIKDLLLSGSLIVHLAELELLVGHVVRIQHQFVLSDGIDDLPSSWSHAHIDSDFALVVFEVADQTLPGLLLQAIQPFVLFSPLF